MIKYFRFSLDYVLWEISYVNLNMLLATIPSYKEEKEKEEVNVVEGIDELSNYLNL